MAHSHTLTLGVCRLHACLQMSVAVLAPWGVVMLLCLGLIETYRLAALWDEEDFEKRAYPGKGQRGLHALLLFDTCCRHTHSWAVSTPPRTRNRFRHY